ncbi:MAG: response regulator transcription factor [Bacteroidetes bacterium]|nr:response regulator transcription factor [Bacteroidota bacterium]
MRFYLSPILKVLIFQNRKLFVLIFILLYNCAIVPLKLKACIVDDEILAIAALKVDIINNCTDLDIVGCFQNPTEAYDFLKVNKVDVLFLDIEMPVLSGIELLEKIGNFQFDVVFITAYSEYALKAIKLHAWDYLLKPVDAEELKKSVSEISKRREMQKHSSISKIALADVNSIEIVDIDNISYCLADKNYTTFYLKNSRKITVSKNIGEYHKLLDHEKFFRIHQSVIVNIYHISKILKGDIGGVIMNDGNELGISRAHKKEFLEVMQRIALM